MVAILKCAGDEKAQLDFNDRLHTQRGEEWTWKPTRRRVDWERGRASHLTLILAANKVIKLGWTTRRQRAGDLDQVLEVSRIEPVDPPVPYSNVTERLSGRYTAYLVEEGTLSDGTGQALVEALVGERPDLQNIVARIEGVADKYPIDDSPPAQVMALQRDASIGAVRMAGMDASDFARWDRPTTALAADDVPPTFVDRISGQDSDQDLSGRALEDQQINHDTWTMFGWLARQAQHIAWREFTGFGQRLFVANANRDTAEATMGVDLIYYNMSRGSMILVQYKRLDAAKNGFYYPDSDRNLASEIERMHRVDRYVASHRNAHDDFRMEPSPCWIKLCHPQAYIPQTADMIYGMYFSLDHFQRLREDPGLKGPRRGVRFGYDNVPSYLDNSTFAKLVETGLVGTSGTSTDLVYQQVIQSYNGHKALVLATLSGEDMPQAKRNTEKRKQVRRRLSGFVASGPGCAASCTPPQSRARHVHSHAQRHGEHSDRRRHAQRHANRRIPARIHHAHTRFPRLRSMAKGHARVQRRIPRQSRK